MQFSYIDKMLLLLWKVAGKVNIFTFLKKVLMLYFYWKKWKAHSILNV